jgi:hypothetical protein
MKPAPGKRNERRRAAFLIVSSLSIMDHAPNQGDEFAMVYFATF